MAYFLIPRGTPLHELVHLPYYWWKIKAEEAVLPKGQKRSYGQDARQYYLLFSPAPDSRKKDRIVIYFHGGAWRYGKPELFGLVAERFTQKGFTTILPSCRRTPRYNYHDVRADLDALMNVLQKEHPGEAVRFIVGGMSSGGNLAAHLFYNQIALKKQGMAIEQFQGLLLLGAPLDLIAMPRNAHVRSFAGKPGSPLFQEANVQHHVQADDRRSVLCIHGKQDGLVPFASAEQFFTTLQKIESGGAQRLHPTRASHLDVAAWATLSSPYHPVIMEWLDTFD